MEILEARLNPYCLPLKQAWASASEAFTERRGWIIELVTQSGLHGYGDSAPLPSAGTEQPAEAASALERQVDRLLNLRPESALQSLPPMPATPAARCGIESALLDLLCQQQQQPLYRWLQPEACKSVAVNEVLGAIGRVSGDGVKQAVEAGFQILKLKVGLGPVSEELALIDALCKGLPPGIRLRLDANKAWNPSQARDFIGGIAHLPVESLEEPLSIARTETLQALQSATHIPLALDESLNGLDTHELLNHSPVKRLVLKPMAQGGVLPAMKLAQAALKQDIEVVITTTVDSAYGVAAATHLAAAISPGQPALCHGLATGNWLASDLGRFAQVEHGRIELPRSAGLGVTRYP